MKFLIFFFLYLPSAFAGNGWIGSGGDLIRDSKNPWWLQNTKEIKYCIQFDSLSMSTSEEKAEILVESIFSGWLKEWRYFFKKQNRSLKLGDQNLKKIDCNGLEDISFNFGWNSLTRKQQEYIESTRSKDSVVGLTVRTVYDKVNLRGKGFIYISSDIGPNKFDLGRNYYSQPWRHEFFLSLVLAHEIGHTFGVQHSSQFMGLMQENIFDLVLQKSYAGLIKSILDKSFDFRYFSRIEKFKTKIDGFDHEAAKFFKVNPKNHLILSKVVGAYEYLIYEETSLGQRNLIYRFTYKTESVTHNFDGTTLTVYLPKEQEVYPPSDNYLIKFNRTYIFTNPNLKNGGILEDMRDGSKKSVLLYGDDETLKIHHLKDGRMIEIEFYSDLYGAENGVSALNFKK